jgi:hypothetical protein
MSGYGGKRKGAGRPPKGEVRELVNFTLSRETIKLLRGHIIARYRSIFVDNAIRAAFRVGGQTK